MSGSPRFHGFAYGEHRDGPRQRSLGFRRVAPAAPRPWASEVEALARRLHAAPYPDDWPPAELFCSVLLTTGERLVAAARYGLRDSTPSGRPGGLELIGVVGPAGLGTRTARAVYYWLKQRRSESPDLGVMDREFDLTDFPAAVESILGDTSHSPPYQVWQDGPLLCAATLPGDPDSRLGLLEHGAAGNWQWLPLVGNDFPLAEYSARGSLVAWVPHVAGSVPRSTPPHHPPPAPVPHRARSPLWPLLVLLLIGLISANLWFTYTLSRKERSATLPQLVTQQAALPVAARDPAAANDAEQLALAIHRYLQKSGGLHDISPAQLMASYDRLAARDEGFRMASPEAKLAIGALAQLARRSPAQVEEAARQALDGKGFDPELVQLICRKIYQRLNDGKD